MWVNFRFLNHKVRLVKYLLKGSFKKIFLIKVILTYEDYYRNYGERRKAYSSASIEEMRTNFTKVFKNVQPIWLVETLEKDLEKDC